MAFLSYIIDFYDTLPEVTAFVHPRRYYGAEIRFDTLHDLQNLNASNVEVRTTTSLRCANVIDPNAWKECETNPRHLALDGPDRDVLSPEQVRMMAQMNQTVWRQVLLEGKVEDIGGPACCAQFVVTAGELRKRTRDDYQRQREALIVK
ncbi:hypothetical protein B9Z65_9228 [Elsinoe australis]|uniref:Uncharacterized protein n=1 Tax=Elsinoe australis TaxID=40998 RepID=A0A2P7Z0U7_9PEZI|nr:hypothetical protein B9Z65_9228 [Elsinoe australis]